MLLAPPAPVTDPSVDSAVHRLSGEFATRLDRTTVVRVVETAREQLRGSPADALPELVERLARHCLADALA
jgi:hypothetical protein